MSTNEGLRVYKFGGTSVQDAERILRVVDLVEPALEEGVSPVVVVSALGGTTDVLLEMAETAARGEDGWEELVDELEARHLRVLAGLGDLPARQALEEQIRGAARELADLARGISLVGECSPRTGDRIVSFGERLSAPLVAAAFRSRGIEAEAHDAREFVVTDGTFGAARVLRDETERLLRERFTTPGPVRVVTGFLGATEGGETTTLGRGASDYTATLVGAALDVDRVEIWTDVDGIMSADPRLVPDAFPLESVTYDELLELSNFGAKVVAPLAVHPARERRVPLRIRNTLNPDFSGTRVVPGSEREARNPVRGITAIDQVVLLRLENVERVGLMETAERLFGALRRRGADLLLYTQDSSGHNLSFAVAPQHLDRVRDAFRDEFERERSTGLLDELVVETRRSVIAAVGEGMRETPGVAAKLFDVLGEERVNIHAIAQGSSERNISCVVTAGDEGRTMRALHAAFFRDPGTVRLYVAGTGQVGSALLEQLAELGPGYRPRPNLRLELVGVGRSRGAVVVDGGLASARWAEAVESGSDDPELLFRAAKEDAGPRIVVDCTASSAVADRYEELSDAGVAVVTANKLAFSGSMDRYRRLRDVSRDGAGLWYRTTVGAGLPMIRTVADLRVTGDPVVRLEGVLSGTLGYLLHAVREGRAFSDALREAQERGMAEPDPREDLGCMDVARKLLILGREAGLELEPDDVCVEPVVPERFLRGETPEAFEAARDEIDAWMAERAREAASRDARLVPLAVLEEDRAEVGLREVAADHPAARLQGADNVLVVTSRRYGDAPIVIQGPGAGREVTAEQLLADVVEAGSHLVSVRRHGRRLGAPESIGNGDGGSP